MLTLESRCLPGSGRRCSVVSIDFFYAFFVQRSILANKLNSSPHSGQFFKKNAQAKFFKQKILVFKALCLQMCKLAYDKFFFTLKNTAQKWVCALILIERAIKNEPTGNNLLWMKRAYNKTKIVQWRLLNLNSLTKNTASESKTVVFLKSFLITSKFPTTLYQEFL